MFLATANKLLENLSRFFELAFKITLMSASFFSTLIEESTIAERAFWNATRAPAEAPKAKTRALEASRAFSNSPN